MQPKIVAVAGPLAGSSFTLPDGDVCVGRAPYNWLSLNSSSVSRQHFQLEPTAAGWKLTDLDSHNGTFVNGTPVKERVLENGDQIQAGDSHFVFALSEENLGAAAPVADETQHHTRTVQTRPSDAPLFSPRAAALTEAERKLFALLKISAALPAIRDLELLRQEFSDRVREILPASRVALYWLEAGGPVEVGGGAGPAAEAPALVAECWKSSSAILAEGPDRWVMAAPLLVAGTVRGALYVEGGVFSSEHLDLAVAIATLAAPAIDNLYRLRRLEADNRRLRDESGADYGMIGEGAAIEGVRKILRRVAPMDSTVLLLGENGTGKELAARAVHRLSARRDRPFVVVNCATLKEALLESELFGHEKGAFTGAIAQKKGRIELAEGGTLFLDEIGELEPGLQAKLLRVLQEREYERVGGTRTLKADIRLVAATNRDLKQAIEDGTFREDLFYRLNVVAIPLPPLRERKADIPLLAAHFVALFAARCNRPVRGISDEARGVLVRYDWPGNVRELQNTIERAIVLGAGEQIEVEDLPESMLETPAADGAALPAYHEGVRHAKRRQILDAIEAAGGNITEAARRLGVNANYLHRLITKLGLRGDLAGRGGETGPPPR